MGGGGGGEGGGLGEVGLGIDFPFCFGTITTAMFLINLYRANGSRIPQG